MEKDKMSTQLMYRPLPDSVTIKQSEINGLGLFSQKGIAQGTNLGITHLEMAKVDNKQAIYRTPLGGFINHSNTPNCAKIELHANGHEPFQTKWNLVTLRDIKKGEEVTVRYTFYNV